MKTIFSIILSLVILITSMGFTVSSHVCGGKKVKSVVSLGAADVSCGMEKKANNCSTKPIMKDNCCEDKYELIQNDEDYTQQVTSVEFSPHFLIAFVISYVELFENETTETDFFSDHSPPPLIKDFPVLMQTFLI